MIINSLILFVLYLFFILKEKPIRQRIISNFIFQNCETFFEEIKKRPLMIFTMNKNNKISKIYFEIIIFDLSVN